MIKLMVYNPDDDFDEELPKSMISIQEYLENPPEWKFNKEETFIILDNLSIESNVDLNPFGVFDFLFPQFQEAIERLENEKFAIIKSAGDWQSIFIILEPINDAIYFSVLGTIPYPWSAYYPLIKSPFFTNDKANQRIELYAYIKKNRQNLKPDNLFCKNIKILQNIKFSKNRFIKSLKYEVKMSLRLQQSLLKKSNK